MTEMFFEKCGITVETPIATSGGTDVSAAHAPDLQLPDDIGRFTEQQITDYCEKVENLCLMCRNEGALMFESVQIIRQLMRENIEREELFTAFVR